MRCVGLARLSFEKRSIPTPYPFALSSSSPASTREDHLRDLDDDCFQAKTAPSHDDVAEDTLDRFLPTYQPALSAPVLSVLDLASSKRPPREISGVRIRCNRGEGLFHVTRSRLVGRAATRTGIGRPFSSVHDFTEGASSPPCSLWRTRGSRSFPAWLREKACLVAIQNAFHRPTRRVPHLLAEGVSFLLRGEETVSLWTSIPRTLPWWSDETPPFARVEPRSTPCGDERDRFSS